MMITLNITTSKCIHILSTVVKGASHVNLPHPEKCMVPPPLLWVAPPLLKMIRARSANIGFDEAKWQRNYSSRTRSISTKHTSAKCLTEFIIRDQVHARF